MKLVTVIGARPQFIKASALSRAIQRREEVEEILLHTGQHYDTNMSEFFFRDLEITTPKYNLEINAKTHGAMTGRQMEGIERVLVQECPDAVMVYGDTNSTLAGALAGAKLNIPVAHVEAGLRSFNRRMPEEVNRIVTDHISTWLFAPTAASAAHLKREGIEANKVHMVGDVMYDVALFCAARARHRSRILPDLGLEGRPYVVATVHRAENTGDRRLLSEIFQALTALTTDLDVIVPLHPRTRIALEEFDLLDRVSSGVRLIPPLGYIDMCRLVQCAKLIVTDSGGLQKEAFFCGKPCVTLRLETEWTELADLGWNYLPRELSLASITEACQEAISKDRWSTSPDGVYGMGDAAERILDILLDSGDRAASQTANLLR